VRVVAEVRRFLVDGQWRVSDQILEVGSPFTGEVASLVALGKEEDLESAIQASVRAFEETRALPVHRRVEVFEKIIRGLSEKREEIAETITRESGKPIFFSRIEVDRCIFNMTCAMEEAKRIYGEVIPMDLKPWGEGRFALTRRFPVGAVFGISPFNFPLNLSAHKVAPALAVGNTLILKPPSACPGAALELAQIADAAGALPGSVNVIPCRPALAERCAADERIRLVSFTGSPSVGYRLQAIAAKKRVILELGGNAGVIVHGDAHIDTAVERIALGGYGQAGQSCIAVQRVYVEQRIYDEVLHKLIEATRTIRMGDPMDPETRVGPMVSEDEARRVEDWVNEAVRGGALVLAGGRRDGAFYEPTLLANVTPSMKVSCREVFAPILTVEPYRDFEDAVRRVDDSRYGLQAGLFTRDIGRIHYAFTHLEVGGLIVNDVPTFRMDHMPYGGVKESGIGREGVRYAIEETTELKLLVLDLH
jgi:acyl-CoA reductase-like NAD-dependent aldehyde dehydrogenase